MTDQQDENSRPHLRIGGNDDSRQNKIGTANLLPHLCPIGADTGLEALRGHQFTDGFSHDLHYLQSVPGNERQALLVS